MNIGIDWDDTYTRDPVGWNVFIKLMVSRGHSIFIVTWRDADEAKEIIEYFGDGWLVDSVHATNRKAKMKYMFDQGICIDVVIDDNPSSWIQDMATYEPNGLWQ